MKSPTAHFYIENLHSFIMKINTILHSDFVLNTLFDETTLKMF